MRILDSVPAQHLHKLLLVEKGGMFAICHQSSGRRPDSERCTLSEEEAFQQWKERVYHMFLAVTHNPRDSEALAERRLATLH